MGPIKKIMMQAIKPIIAPIMKIINMIKGLGKVFKNLLKPLVSFFLQIISTMAKAFAQIKNAFTNIFATIACAINRLKNFPKCILYYLIDAIFFTLLIPIRILIVVFPALEEFESTLRETIDKIDVIVHTISLQTIGKGLHINKWPDGVLNKCYRCKDKFDDPVNPGDLFSKLFSNNDFSKNFFGFFLKSIIILFGMGCCVVVIMSFFSAKKCANPLNPA